MTKVKRASKSPRWMNLRVTYHSWSLLCSCSSHPKSTNRNIINHLEFVNFTKKKIFFFANCVTNQAVRTAPFSVHTTARCTRCPNLRNATRLDTYIWMNWSVEDWLTRETDSTSRWSNWITCARKYDTTSMESKRSPKLNLMRQSTGWGEVSEASWPFCITKWQNSKRISRP